VYDIHRLGIFLTASPRHADILLVTGAGAHGMAEPLRETYEAMPHPKVVIAVGTDACGGGLVSPSYATAGGIGAIVPVDVWLPGSPPTPFAILSAILLGLGRLPESGLRAAAAGRAR
jgi:Ni,Fe-hydrogenase III small subunit